MTNVISLDAFRQAPLSTTRPPQPALTTIEQFHHAVGQFSLEVMSIDFSKVTRLCAQNPDGSFQHSLEDPVTFTPEVELQIRQIFWRFGLRQLPATWGELFGNQSYCMQLNCWGEAFKPRYSPDTRICAFQHHEEQHPGRGKLLSMIADGDLAGAWEWHQAQGTFEANGRDLYLTAIDDD